MSRQGFLIALLVAGAFVAPARAQPVELMPGVTYEKQVRFTLHGPVGVNVLVAPRPGGLYSFQPVLSNELIQGSEKLTAIEQRLAATTTTAGVNGDVTGAVGLPTALPGEGGAAERRAIGTEGEGRRAIADGNGGGRRASVGRRR